MGASPYFSNLAINALLRQQTATFPVACFLALFNSDPLSDNPVEVSLGGYARQTITFTPPLNGSCQNTTDVSFGTTTIDWGTVGYWAVYDSLVGGNLLVSGEFDDSADVPMNQTVIIEAGTLQLGLE